MDPRGSIGQVQSPCAPWVLRVPRVIVLSAAAARVDNRETTQEENPMRLLAAALALLTTTAALAQPLPTAPPEQLGFSSEGLARIDRFFAREIAQNRVPGAIVAIARDGKLV